MKIQIWLLRFVFVFGVLLFICGVAAKRFGVFGELPGGTVLGLYLAGIALMGFGGWMLKRLGDM